MQRPQGYVKPVPRTRGSLTLAVLYRVLQPVTFAYLSVTVQDPRAFSFADTAPLAPTPTPTSEPTLSSSPLPWQSQRLFIDAIARSCLCRQHLRVTYKKSLISNRFHKPKRKPQDFARQIRGLHNEAISLQPHLRKNALSRKDCLGMLDWYEESFSTHAMNHDSKQLQTNTEPVPYSIVDDSFAKPRSQLYERNTWASASSKLPESLDSSREIDVVCDGLDAIRNLQEVLLRDHCTHEAAFEAYSLLPSLGISYLSRNTTQLLFHRLSVMEKKDYDSMLRYLSVVEDTRNSGRQLTYPQWTSAISFCGQCFDRVTAADVERALKTWKTMEEEAGIKGGNVTFNILFDIAAKAGKFVLAEMILQEMEIRNLTLDRYARVGQMFYHGLRADGDAIRRTYRDFVHAGEIVDTVVMNCLIASLLRAGEPAAAEQIYERMKRRLADHQGKDIPYLDWREVRELGRVLKRAACDLKHQPDKFEQLQAEQILAPNVRTYAILLEHHVSRTGEFNRITNLLAEMHELGLPLDGRIFLKIFKGFTIHGGGRYTAWTKGRLESVWNAFVAVLDESDLVIKKMVIVWMVRAFRQCAGQERTLEVWGEVKRRWKGRNWGESERMIRDLEDALRPP